MLSMVLYVSDRVLVVCLCGACVCCVCWVTCCCVLALMCVRVCGRLCMPAQWCAGKATGKATPASAVAAHLPLLQHIVCRATPQLGKFAVDAITVCLAVWRPVRLNALAAETQPVRFRMYVWLQSAACACISIRLSSALYGVLGGLGT